MNIPSTDLGRPLGGRILCNSSTDGNTAVWERSRTTPLTSRCSRPSNPIAMSAVSTPSAPRTISYPGECGGRRAPTHRDIEHAAGVGEAVEMHVSAANATGAKDKKCDTRRGG